MAFVHRRRSRGQYTQNIGRPGVIYILANGAFKQHVYKIGCTTRSGSTRASELNSEAGTGTPAWFSCLYECKTLDCGRAERRVFKELAAHRCGKWGQEYFEVDVEVAKATIERVCRDVDAETDRVAEDATFDAGDVRRPPAWQIKNPLPVVPLAVFLVAVISFLGFTGRPPERVARIVPPAPTVASSSAPAPRAESRALQAGAHVTPTRVGQASFERPVSIAPDRGERAPLDDGLTVAQRESRTQLGTVGLAGAPRLVFATMRLRMDELTAAERRELETACATTDKNEGCVRDMLARLYVKRNAPVQRGPRIQSTGTSTMSSGQATSAE